MMACGMQAKSGGRDASMDLGFGVAGLFDEARVYGVRKCGINLRTSVLFEVT
jgi:hypothetical protein